MAALAARGHRARADPRAELDHRDEAVAVVAIPAPRPGLGFGPNGCERTKRSLSEGHGDARRRIAVLGVGDRRRNPLKAVDLAPWHLPAAEVALQPRQCLLEDSQLEGWRGVARQAHEG